MTPQQYCLRWKFHQNNLQTMFSNLLDRGCFCDVTIACEGLLLKAHRVVLVACSTYFDAILTNCSLDKEPIIVMRDCKYDDIKSLLDFMYKGEINVEHKNLSSLLKTAEDLCIKGLAEMSWKDDMNEGGGVGGGAGDAMITRSRKQFAAAMAASGQGAVIESRSSTEPHVGAHVVGVESISNSSRQSPMHLLQSRLNAPPPETHYTASAHQHSHQPHPSGRHAAYQANSAPHSRPTALANYQHTPQQFHNNSNHSQLPDASPVLPVKRKRGRPPLDGEFDSYSTPKITHVESGALADTFNAGPAATSIVEAVLEDGSQSAIDPQPNEPTPAAPSSDPTDGDDPESRNSQGHVRLVDLPALLSQGPIEQRRPRTHGDTSKRAKPTRVTEDEWPEYGMQVDIEDDSIAGGLIPKLERPDTPDEASPVQRHHTPAEFKFAAQQQRSDSPPSTTTTSANNYSDLLTPQEMEDWKDVVKMNDYLKTGGKRPQFWDERFTMRVMESIKNKELEMKKGASLMGVSYGTLYGRYRETFGCLKHPFRNAMWTRGESLDVSVNGGGGGGGGGGSVAMPLNGSIRQRLESPTGDWDNFGITQFANRPHISLSPAIDSTYSLVKYYDPPSVYEAAQRENWSDPQSTRAPLRDHQPYQPYDHPPPFGIEYSARIVHRQMPH